MNEAPEHPSASDGLSPCPCKSRGTYTACCQPFHLGTAKPETAEQLMRSRYSAFFFRLVGYLLETTHPDTRHRNLKTHLEATIHEATWTHLTILGSSNGGPTDKTGKVRFIAEYFENGGHHELHEHSRFKRHKGAWKYLDARG